VDERRHNTDGALFVDDERDDDRPARGRRGEDDHKADDARRVTQGILDRMDLEARVSVREDDERVVLDIDGADAGRAIGKKGATLEALQFLVNKIVNRDPDEATTASATIAASSRWPSARQSVQSPAAGP
jgi:predicted RNA-binding protein Jag